MYIKRTRKWRSSREITYLSLAHNVWEERPDGEKQTRPLILLALGPEHEADPTYLKDLVASAQAMFDRRMADGMGAYEAAHDVACSFQPHQGAVRVLANRKLGMRLLLAPIWKELGIQEALCAFAKEHRLRAFDFERLVFGLVINRIIDPKSKRAANEWLQDDAYFPEAEGWEAQHYYRALDILHEHWEELEQRLFQALWEASSEEKRKLWLTDTTSMYFEANADDTELAELSAEWDEYDAGEREMPPRRPRPSVVNEPALRMRGHNKDGHPGDPQVVIASVCLPNGLVLRHKTYPGNTADVTIASDLLASMPSPDDATVRLWVSDGGMTSEKLRTLLDAGGWFRLTAESLRKSAFARSHTGRYQAHPTKEQYSFKTVFVDALTSSSSRPETWVLVRNAWERERQLKRLAKHVEQVKAALAKKEPDGGHSRSMCEVATHPTLKRYVKPSDKVPGRFVLDQDAIRCAEQLAGTRLLRTTLLDMPGSEVFDAYQLLQVVERNHREYKGPLQLRPCYHRSSERIRAHVMLTILATNCVRMLELRTAERIDDLRKHFDRIMATQVTEYGRRVWTCSELSEADRATLRRAGAGVPPATWQVWRESLATPESQSA
jgi:transposase